MDGHGLTIALEYVPEKCDQCGEREFIVNIGDVVLAGDHAEVPGYSVRCRRCSWGILCPKTKEKMVASDRRNERINRILEAVERSSRPEDTINAELNAEARETREACAEIAREWQEYAQKQVRLGVVLEGLSERILGQGGKV